MRSNDKRGAVLRGRWKTDGGRALAQRAFAWLSGAAALDESDFGFYNGRLDLRGITFAASHNEVAGRSGNLVARKIEGNLRVRDMRIRSVDFSHSRLESATFNNAIIDDCIFHYAELREMRMWGTAMSDCEFEHADLRNVVLGGVDTQGRRCQHTDVRFISSNLVGCSTSDAIFDRVEFDNSNFCKVNSRNAQFRDCVFRGCLRDVIFYNESGTADAMRNPDFSDALFKFTEFRRYDFSEDDGIRWPRDPRHVAFTKYKQVLENAIAALDGEDLSTRRVRVVLALDLKWAGPNQTVGLISLIDQEDVPTSVELLRAVLSRAIGTTGARIISGSL